MIRFPKIAFLKLETHESQRAWVKFLIKMDMLVFFPGILIAALLAYCYGGALSFPFRYSFFSNYISDLGSHHYTPFPYLFDLLVIFTGILCVYVFYHSNAIFQQIIRTKTNTADPTNTTDSSSSSRLSVATRQKAILTLLNLSKYFLILGPLGLAGIGVFSIDRNYFGLHYVFAYIAFFGFAWGSVWIGGLSMFVDTFISHSLAKKFIFVPLIPVIVALVNFLLPVTLLSDPILEWLVLLCIFWWVVPAGLRLVKYMEMKNPIIIPFSFHTLYLPYKMIDLCPDPN